MAVRASLLLLFTLALGLAGCEAVPPTGPTLLALPPEGKDLAVFRQEDAACRQSAAAEVARQSGPDATTTGLQRAYDVAYAQCTAAAGNRIGPAWPTFANGYVPPPAGYPLWDYQPPWEFGPYGPYWVGYGGGGRDQGNSHWHHH